MWFSTLNQTVAVVLMKWLPCMTMRTIVDPLNTESMEGEARRLFSVSVGVRIVCGDQNVRQILHKC